MFWEGLGERSGTFARYVGRECVLVDGEHWACGFSEVVHGSYYIM